MVVVFIMFLVVFIMVVVFIMFLVVFIMVVVFIMFLVVFIMVVVFIMFLVMFIMFLMMFFIIVFVVYFVVLIGVSENSGFVDAHVVNQVVVFVDGQVVDAMDGTKSGNDATKAGVAEFMWLGRSMSDPIVGRVDEKARSFSKAIESDGKGVVFPFG